MLYGSEVWWTGAAHILGQTAATYNTIARIITGLPKWTALRLLHNEAGMPPLDLLLSRHAVRYGVRILLAGDDHPYKPLLLQCIQPVTAAIRPNCTSLQRIADLLQHVLDEGAELEDSSHHDLQPVTPPLIASDTKQNEAANHLKWLDSLAIGTILLYKDDSKTDTGRTASTWACKEITRAGPMPMFHQS